MSPPLLQSRIVQFSPQTRQNLELEFDLLPEPERKIAVLHYNQIMKAAENAFWNEVDDDFELQQTMQRTWLALAEGSEAERSEAEKLEAERPERDPSTNNGQPNSEGLLSTLHQEMRGAWREITIALVKLSRTFPMVKPVFLQMIDELNRDPGVLKPFFHDMLSALTQFQKDPGESPGMLLTGIQDTHDRGHTVH